MAEITGKILNLARVLGLIALISYMIVILYVWISANISGYTYFSGGEPEPWIKYPEWALGILGILVAADYIRKELRAIK